MKQMSLFHHLIDQIHQDQRIPTEEGNGEVKLEQMKKYDSEANILKVV